MLAETPVTQSNPCYAFFLIDEPFTNYSPFYHTHYPILRINTSLASSGQTLYQAALLETNTSLLQRFTAESSRELRRNAEEAEQLAEASVDVPPPPLQIVISVPFCLFSLYQSGFFFNCGNHRWNICNDLSQMRYHTLISFN